MRDYDDLPYIVIERHSGGTSAFFWGALLGAGAALLLAPRSGAETQDEIRRSVQRLRDTAEGRADEVRGSVTRTRNRFIDQIDTVRSTFEDRAERARDAIETGRRTALSAREELERRVEAARSGVAPSPAIEDTPPDVDVVVTDVAVEEPGDRPELG